VDHSTNSMPVMASLVHTLWSEPVESHDRSDANGIENGLPANSMVHHPEEEISFLGDPQPGSNNSDTQEESESTNNTSPEGVLALTLAELREQVWQ
jgi:hypothetical protein